MGDKLPRTLALFAQRPETLRIDDVAKFEGRAPLRWYTDSKSPDWAALKSFYGIHRAHTEWVANLDNPEVLLTNSSLFYEGDALRLNKVTSIDVIAARDKTIPLHAIHPLAVTGITITSDDYVVLGIRATNPDENQARARKVYGSGLIGTVPSGGVKFPIFDSGDPFSSTLIDELRGELGSTWMDTFPVGAFVVPHPDEAVYDGPHGIKIVYGTNTAWEFDGVRRYHSMALARFNDLMSRTQEGSFNKRRLTVKKVLRKEGLPHDVWEHDELIPLRNDARMIYKFLRDESYRLSGAGFGALNTYASWLEHKR